MPLPRILAGPALRRTDRNAVWIWLCTSEVLRLSAEVYVVDDAQQLGERVGNTDAEASLSFRISDSLYVHLVKVVPSEERFDHTTVLGYRLFEDEDGERVPLREYDESGLGVGPYEFPTFCIQNPRSNALRALFASCRKLHGSGRDASLGMLAQLESQLVEGSSRRPRLRPTALFLLGDQIYADDVADLLFPTVVRIAGELRPESLPGVDPDTQANVAARQLVMLRDAGFTSGKAANHLNTLGEYAAMYLLAWNEDTWDAADLAPAAAAEPASGEAEDNAAQRESLFEGRRGSAAMRVLLANVPAYMMFDDHDVTDDWNINPSWTRHVSTKPLGRRVITNALVAYWAFQGWGNDPEAFDEEFRQQITDYLAATGDSAAEQQIRDDSYDFLNCNRREHYWSFVAPTKPGAVFLDLRTHRTATRDTSLRDAFLDLRDPLYYAFTMGSGLVSGGAPIALVVTETSRLRLAFRDLPLREPHLAAELGRTRLNGMAPRFVDSRLRRRARQLVASFARQPMILITGTPAVGASVVDFGQDIAILAEGSFTWDYENWRGDPENLLDLYELMRYSEASACVLLSGDVHYASAFIGELEWPNARGPVRMNVAQFTSSALKNQSFPSERLMRIVQDQLRTGTDLTSRWLGEAPRADGEARPVGRIIFGSAADMRAFAPVFSISGVPNSAALPDAVYCDESWHLQSLNGDGMYMQSNFGWLVASNEVAQVMSVQLRDAGNRVLGDTMRVATTLD